MALNIGEIFINISAGTEGLKKAEAEIKRVSEKTRNLTVVINQLNTQSNTTYNNMATTARRSANVIGKAFSGVGGIIRGVIRTVFNLKSAFGAAAAIYGIKQIVDVSAEFDGLQASMFAVTGSSEKAAEEFAFIKRQAIRLGQEIRVLSKEYIDFSAATKGTTLEGDATKYVFLSIAEAGRVLQMSNEKVHDTFMAVQQIISKGTVQAEEVRRQLGNSIPGAFRMMAEAYAESMGKMSDTTEEKMAALEKAMKAGTVKATQILALFADQLQKNFGGGLEKALVKARAEFGRFSTEVTLLKNAFGGAGVLDLAKFGAREATKYLRELRDIVEQIGPFFKEELKKFFDDKQPKNYFEAVRAGLVWMVQGMIGVVDIFDKIIYRIKQAGSLASGWLDQPQLNSAKNELEGIQAKIEKLQGLIKSGSKQRLITDFKTMTVTSVDTDTSVAQTELDSLQKRAEKLQEVIDGISSKKGTPIFESSDTTFLKKVLDLLTKVKDTTDAAAESAMDFKAGIKGASVESTADIGKILKEVEKIVGGFASVAGQLTSMYQAQAAYHQQMAMEALNYGRSQSELYMQLADSVHYSNNQIAQSYEQRAMAAAESAAKQYQEEQKAREKSNAMAKAMFENQKKLQIAQAIMSTATAVMDTYKNSGLGIYAAPLAAAMGALGAAQVAMISSQKFTPRESGGPVIAGRGYVTSEAGPEIFVPGRSGTIISQKEIMSGLSGGGGSQGGDTIVFKITANDAKGFDELLQSRRGLLMNMIRQAKNDRMGESA